MLSSRLFWKLMLACAGLNLAAAIVFGIVLSKWQEHRLYRQVDIRLRDAALLVRSEFVKQVGDGPSEELQRRIRDLGSETGTRFTLVDMQGNVLADSAWATLEDVKNLENLRNRPEIIQAITLGEGLASRDSASVGEPYHYFALRADLGGEPIGVVRAAVAVADIESQAAALRNWIWGLIGAVCLGVLILSYWIVGHILDPITSLTAAAEAIAAGDYQYRVYAGNRDELGLLARTFNRISQELGGRMAQLSQSNDRQSTVLGGMIEGVIAVDERQRIVLANKAAGRLFDFRAPAAEGRPLLELVRNHALHEAVTKAIASQQPQRLETKHEGSKQCVEIHVQPLPGDPCPGVVLVMHDTTELRRLESLRRDFVANVSHELKTPLSSIKAYTETLRNGAVQDPETSQKFLERIEEQSDRLHRLILDMLMLARVESDQQVFDIVSVNVGDVVSSCLEDHRSAAQAKRIQLATEANLPVCAVRADREGLREILDNLIDNAIKYTPEGGNITVGWQCDGKICRLSVRDTGIGIKPEDQKRVFERFYRVDKARARELGGTGLGLSIVKHLAQSFGGAVDVASEPGKGSTFSVELPVA